MQLKKNINQYSSSTVSKNMKVSFSLKFFLQLLCLTIGLCLIGPLKAYAQPKWKLNVTGKVEENGKAIDGVSIKISKSGAEPITVYSSGNGKFSFTLEPNGYYTVRVTKSGGYITKIITFDTKNVPSDEDERSQPMGFYMEVSLFKEYKGMDLSLLKDPIGKVSYVLSARRFDYDAAYTKSILSRLTQMMTELEAQLKAEAEAAAQEAKKKAEFDAAIQKGDNALSLKKFDDAIKSYNDALNTGVDNATANSKISAANKAKADEEAKKKADEEAKKKTEEEAKNAAAAAKKKAEFDAAIKKGDNALSLKKFDDAIKSYNDALNTGVDNATANSKIDGANKAKADEEAKKKADEEAKKKSEEEAKNAAAAAKKKAEFDAAIQKGDNALGAKKFDDAIKSYNDALNTGVDNATANSKIDGANKAKADEEARLKAEADAKAKADADAANKAELAKKKKEFDAAIQKGDDALGAKKFDDALTAYNNALQVHFDDATANSKIDGANKAKADEEARLKAEADAKAKADADAANKAELAKKKKEFDDAIQKGDDALGAKKFDDALTAYNNALQVHFDDATANSKIDGANKAKADEEARLKAEADAKAKAEADAANKALAQKKAEFDKHISDGDKLLIEKKFDESIATYGLALQMNFDNETANSKIATVQKAKADEEARLKAEADAKAKAEADAAATAELARKKEEFNTFISNGDKSLSNLKFDDAINAFNAALALDVDNPLANRKIEEANKAKEDEEARLKAEADAKAKAEADAAAAAELARKKEEFDKYINKGNQSLSAKNYTDAIAQYGSALALDVDNPLANRKIEEANKAKEDEEARLKAEADAKAKAEADKAAAAELAKKKKEFDAAIQKGDDALGAKKFDDALTAYNNALQVHFDDVTANSKIDGANKAKADEEARLKAEADAKAKAEADEAAAAELARKKAEFDTFISNGDKSLSNLKFDDAIDAFNAALGLNIDNPLATRKIEEANKAKENEEARLKAEADAKAKAEADKAAAAELARKKAEFDQLIKQGESKVTEKKFDSAIEDYTQALSLGIDNTLANTKIIEAQDLKEAEEERRKAQDLAERTRLFHTKIKEGDDLVSQKNFNDAILSYKEALELNIDNPLAQSKIDATQKTLDELERARKKALFDKFINNGNMAMSQKKFSQAVNAYTEALNTDYDNNMAQQKLDDARKREEEEKLRLEALAAKRQADLDDVNRRKKEADERERAFLEKARLAREQAKAELIARIEAQKRALSQADRYKAEREKRLAAQANTGGTPSGTRFDLAKKYPQGVSNEEIEGQNCVIYRTIIVKGEVGDEYKKIKYNFGQVYFKKNGNDITEAIYNKEVSVNAP